MDIKVVIKRQKMILCAGAGVLAVCCIILLTIVFLPNFDFYPESDSCRTSVFDSEQKEEILKEKIFVTDMYIDSLETNNSSVSFVYPNQQKENWAGFPEQIEKGNIYDLTKVSYEIISQRKKPQPSENLRIVMSESFEDETERHVPESELTIKGEKCYLKTWKTVQVSDEAGGKKAVQAVYSDRSQAEASDQIYTVKATASYTLGTECLERSSLWSCFLRRMKRNGYLLILTLLSVVSAAVCVYRWKKKADRENEQKN